MSEPYWSALGAPTGAGQVDYEGAWSAGVSYLAGDVVTYNGVTYLAVNPSTGVVPAGGLAGLDIGTTLPASPVDGQEFILTDSLTAPTFAWKLRYMAGKASNKWLFVGGAPLLAEVVTAETCNITTYGNLATVGPSVTPPLTGDYIVEHGHQLGVAVGSALGSTMSYDIGATGAVDADSVAAVAQSAQGGPSVTRLRRKSLTGGAALVAKYKVSNNNAPLSNRFLAITPIAVGG